MQTHISGKKVLRQKHATLTPSMYSAYKLHTVGSKAFQNKDIRSRGHFLFTNLYHGFASYFRGFCLITKAPPPPRWFFTKFCAIPCPGEEISWSQRSSPCLPRPPAASGQTASVCYGWGAFGKEGGKESLEDQPRCAHKGRAGLLAIHHVPVWREAAGVFHFSLGAVLVAMKQRESA